CAEIVTETLRTRREIGHRDTETQRSFLLTTSSLCLCASVAGLLCVSAPRNMSRLYALRDFCRHERDWVIDTAEALVRLESPTTDKAAVDRCGRELAARLEAIGGRVTRLPRVDRGDHLLAEFPSTSLRAGGCGGTQILLLGHFDTVWAVGQLQKMPLVRSNGR